MIPSFSILFIASVSLTLANALFNLLAQQDGSVTETFRQWSRVLWMSRAAHIVEAPSSAEAHRMTHTRHIVAVSAQPTPVMSPVELYDSAAFFRGIAAPSAEPGEHAFDVEDITRTNSYSEVHSRLHTPAPSPFVAVSREAASPTAEVAMVYHTENPPASVPAPVVAEALTNTMEAVRLESQRLIFRFHPYYIIMCSMKAFAMLLYVQYHFDSIEGGWQRFCVCGAANIFSGLLTPVWEYFNVLLLPLDPDRAQPAVVKVDEEKADSVFIVELLFRISSLELDDLPTVLTQGSSFVAFSAVLVPLLMVFCVPGFVRYCWMYAPLWSLYAVVRHLYYRGAGALPSSTARNAAAVVGLTTEMVKAFMMKTFTFFVVLVTVQSTFLLGLAWAEKSSYDAGLQYAMSNELTMHRGDLASSFQIICLLSQLIL
ncbi:hypothetical protein ABL78_2890 [Leptomonas seymouri]|uniref:Transmembrane protein n=1 Tax=Leptomonas seymouri TaxID=5684 RepID=A0A0N1I8L9_LEPSE|nr:hypothetical protein ABL78_2890 [Leptomonas seymouri]|eukprot:KPI88014.1 hypothetical protein ABL78_2890 [Leptomonas seymouri]